LPAASVSVVSTPELEKVKILDDLRSREKLQVPPVLWLRVAMMRGLMGQKLNELEHHGGEVEEL
jgi:hypothetical protein